jgi:hypothetical protein
MAIANGEVAWQPNRILQQFEKDLELLPYIFAQSEDYIIVSELPENEFLNSLKTIKNISPNYIPKSRLKDEKAFQNHQNINLQPWGWSPVAHHLLNSLKSKTSQSFRNSLNFIWKEKLKEIVSRKFSAIILNSICNKNPSMPYTPKSLHPVSIDNVNKIEEYVRKWNQVVLKAPWSSSGRGVQMLRYAEINKSNKQWVSGVIKQQGFIMIEPLLDKIEDFSLQFHISPKKIEFLGVGKFETNTNGQYISNTINPDTQFIEKIVPLERLVLQITDALKLKKIQESYEGYAGFDLMTINYNNQVLIQPCVEINWRYNMGLVALQLQKLIHPQAKGTFGVHFHPKKSFISFADEKRKEYPLTLKNNLPFKGFFPLSNPQNAISGAFFILD